MGRGCGQPAGAQAEQTTGLSHQLGFMQRAGLLPFPPALECLWEMWVATGVPGDLEFPGSFFPPHPNAAAFYEELNLVLLFVESVPGIPSLPAPPPSSTCWETAGKQIPSDTQLILSVSPLLLCHELIPLPLGEQTFPQLSSS